MKRLHAEIICTGPDVNVSLALGHRKLRDEDDQCTVLAVEIADGAVLAVVKERHPKVRGGACFLLRPRAVTIAIDTASTSPNVGNTSARRASTISAGTDDAADAQHHRTEEGRHRLHDPHRQACS